MKELLFFIILLQKQSVREKDEQPKGHLFESEKHYYLTLPCCSSQSASEQSQESQLPSISYSHHHQLKLTNENGKNVQAPLHGLLSYYHVYKIVCLLQYWVHALRGIHCHSLFGFYCSLKLYIYPLGRIWCTLLCICFNSDGEMVVVIVMRLVRCAQLRTYMEGYHLKHVCWWNQKEDFGPPYLSMDLKLHPLIQKNIVFQFENS